MMGPAARIGLAVSLAVGVGGFIGCAPTPSPLPPPWFEDVAAGTGLGFVARSGHNGKYLLPEIVFGGAALVDVDGDGDLDAYLIQGGSVTGARSSGNRLFANDGTGRFTDITDGSGSGDPGFGMGVTTGDYNNDGHVDLYVTNLGPNVLLRNNGDGTFVDVSQASGTDHPGFGASAAFFDHDADGDLDLFVVNYVNWTAAAELTCYNNHGVRDYCLPTNYDAPAPDVLFENRGDGTFENISQTSGIESAFGYGLGVGVADFDGDGRQDVFVANDTTLNQLWMNQGDGRFIDEALIRGVALDQHGTAKAGMGVALGDLDADLDTDLLVVNLRNQSDSYFQNDAGLFSDRTAQVGVAVASRRMTRFGVGFADFDNDGALDLFEASGAVQVPGEPPGDDPYAQANLLFRGSADGRFEEHPVPDSALRTSRGAAFGDIDNDGGIDILIVNRDANVELLKNVVPTRGHWLLVRVLDRHGRDALGARVSVDIGGRTTVREVRSAYSYCTANDARVHLGLGEQSTAANVTVRWVDGSTTTFGDLDADQVVELRRPPAAP